MLSVCVRALLCVLPLFFRVLGRCRVGRPEWLNADICRFDGASLLINIVMTGREAENNANK